MVVVANDVRMDPRGLERVAELFYQQIEEGIHPGAALAVYRFGRLALDLREARPTGRRTARSTTAPCSCSTPPPNP